MTQKLAEQGWMREAASQPAVMYFAARGRIRKNPSPVLQSGLGRSFGHLVAMTDGQVSLPFGDREKVAVCPDEKTPPGLPAGAAGPTGLP